MKVKTLNEPAAPVTVTLPISALMAIAEISSKEGGTRHNTIKQLILLGLAAHQGIKGHLE